jgi:hypothetical protein
MMTPSTPSAPVRDLVALATRAPSVHNTQPWYWCAVDEQLVLFADRSRQLMHADPDGRDLILSCGAALHHLQVAAAAAGWRARVHRMPNPYNDAQLANISFDPAAATPAALAALDALKQRRTDRRAPGASPVPREQLDSLLALGPRSGVTIVAVVSHRARTELLQILAEADRAQRLNSDYVDEIIHWTGHEDDEGIPSGSLLRRAPLSEPEGPGPATIPSRFPSGTLADDPQPAGAEPALLAVCTSSDDIASRLRAGEALSALLVHGRAAGLAMVPLSQAIEVDHTRDLLQDELLADAACPQILVQAGWSAPGREQVPPTRRRPVDEVLGDVASLPPGMGTCRA